MENSEKETTTVKKDPFENLTKEELIKKCRQFLAIAQKAKQTKDEVIEESKKITNKLQEIENKSQSDINTLQETLNVLTQQKLELVTNNDTLTKQKNVIEKELKSCRQELINVNDKIQTLDTENQSYSRQVNRLSDENDQLITQLDTLEQKINELNTVCEQQQNQIVSLEKQNYTECQDNNSNTNAQETDVDNKYNEEIKQLEAQCNEFKNDLNHSKSLINEKNQQLEICNDEIKLLNEKNEELNEICVSESKKLNEMNFVITNLNTNIDIKDDTIKSLENDLENVKIIKDSYNDKLKSYHAKLIKVFTDMKDLKQNRKQLLSVTEDYSKHVLKWQNEMKLVSNKFCEQIKIRDVELEACKSDNNQLRQINHQMEKQLSQLKSCKNENSEIITELNSLKNEIEIKDKNINSLIVEKTELENIISEIKKKSEENDNIQAIIQQLKLENDELTKHLENEKDKCESALKENNNLLTKLNKYEEELQNNVEVKLSLENKIKEQFENISLLSNEKLQLTDNFALMKEELNKAEKFVLSNESLQQKNENLLTEIKLLNEKLTASNKEISSYQRDCSDLQNQLAISKRENVELLKEMNDMNQALKDRGETISKQQEYAQDLLRKIQNLEQDILTSKQQNIKLEDEVTVLKTNAIEQDASKTTIQEHNAVLQEKIEKIKVLEQEILHLKESLNSSITKDGQDGGYGDSETMSTSTISRAEDTGRLRDLEGSWEERYSKLRTLALKLKSKVKELSEQLSQERLEKNDIQNKLTTVTRNLQSVQGEYDKIQDQFEVVEKDNKKNVKQIENLTIDNSKMKQDLVINTEKMSKLQLDLETLQKEKLGSSSAAKQFTVQIQNLKKDIENNNTTIKDLENKISKLESSLSTKDEDLQKEMKAHNNTKERLIKVEKDIKKTSVLNLEMDDYERSLKDLSQKLDKKNEFTIELEEKISCQDGVIKTLKDQIRLMEERQLTKNSEYEELEKQLLETRTKLSSCEVVITQKENRIHEVIKSLENYKITSEEENSGLSQSLSDNQKQIEQLKTENSFIKSKVLGLEEKIKELTKSFRDSEQELTHVQNEFSNYKVRAQSVLRQNQTRDIAEEEKLSEEVSLLKLQVESLTSQLDTYKEKLTLISSQFEKSEIEKSQAIARCSDLEKKLIKERGDNKNLSEQQRQLISDHREAMRAQKIHTDTLVQCYKQQLQEQEERHVKEFTELKHTANQSILAQTQTFSKEENLDITSMQREDAEGSESVDSQCNNSKTVLLSLDKLLNTDVDNLSTLNYEVELTACKKQLTEFEAKVAHLTDLLADAEQDLAKHTQLNQLLKEEIRRHQRSVEREKHAENLEYLKNVVFKFLTLNNGDEKSHLVPVLNTILKLSPEETQKLNAVAKGTDIRSWGSYLPIWSGSNNH